MKWNDDSELFALIKEQLYSPVIGDVLDSLGCFHQFLPREIQPMRVDMKLAGRAMPVLACEVYGEQKKPFGKLSENMEYYKNDD